MSALQGIEPGLPDPQAAMYTTVPQSFAVKSKGEIRTDCNFCQISLLSKVRKTSLRLGTFKISFLIVTNSRKSQKSTMSISDDQKVIPIRNNPKTLWSVNVNDR